MMIRLVVQDSERPVQLLYKDEPHQFVRKSHLAERNLLVGTVIDLVGESVWAAHYKH